MIKIIFACLASCYFGMTTMSCFAVNSYNKGYEDRKGKYESLDCGGITDKEWGLIVDSINGCNKK